MRVEGIRVYGFDVARRPGVYVYVEAPRGLADTEWRLTPSLTWWESEFVFLRLESEHRDSDLEGTRNLLSLQAVWAMGPHKHETY